MNNNPITEQAQRIESILKDKMSAYFGMSPPTCFAHIQSPYLVITLEGIISPLEKVLIQQREICLVEQMKRVVMDQLLKEVGSLLNQAVGIHINRWYYDWKYGANKGILIALEQKWLPKSVESSSSHALVDIVLDCYTKIHKEPQSVRVIEVNKEAFLLACSGVLFDIEKKLVKQGHEKLLRRREGPRKTSLLHRLSQKLSWDYDQTCDQVSVLWDYQNDTALIYLSILKAN